MGLGLEDGLPRNLPAVTSGETTCGRASRKTQGHKVQEMRSQTCKKDATASLSRSFASRLTMPEWRLRGNRPCSTGSSLREK